MGVRRVQYGANNEIIQQGEVDGMAELTHGQAMEDSGIQAATNAAKAQINAEIAEFRTKPPGHHSPEEVARYEDNMATYSTLSGVKAVNVNAENEARRAAQSPLSEAKMESFIDSHDAKTADLYDTVQRAGMMKMAGQPLPKGTREHLVKTLMDINIIRERLGYGYVTDADFGLDQL